MKKSLYLLAALSLLGTNVFAKEVVAEPVVSPVVKETGIVEEVVNQETDIMTEIVVPADKWSFGARTYLETEDFDNGSPISGGDDEDGTFWGVGVSATKGKLTLDLNVEKRFGGDLSLSKSDAEWEATRVDYKVRYQLFEKQAFHLKYRTEERVRDFSRDTYHSNWTRDRFELGTDFNHFNGLLAGWLVAGLDRDKVSVPGEATSRDNGWYWEGDFGPSFKLTDKLSLNTTLFTTGEMYDSYEMVETQIRVMLPYQVNDKLTIMPRVRFTLDRTNDDGNGNKVWEYEAGDRIRYELMANIVISDNLSSFVGVAYEQADRQYVDGGTKDIDLIWSYVGLNYAF